MRSAVHLAWLKETWYNDTAHNMWSGLKQTQFQRIAELCSSHIRTLDLERQSEAQEEIAVFTGTLPDVNWLQFREFLANSPSNASVNFHGPFRWYLEDLKETLEGKDLQNMGLHALVRVIIAQVDLTVKPEWVSAVAAVLDGDTTPSAEIGALFPKVGHVDQGDSITVDEDRMLYVGMLRSAYVWYSLHDFAESARCPKRLPYDTAMVALAAKDTECQSPLQRANFWTALWSLARDVDSTEINSFPDIVDKAIGLSKSTTSGCLNSVNKLERPLSPGRIERELLEKALGNSVEHADAAACDSDLGIDVMNKEVTLKIARASARHPAGVKNADVAEKVVDLVLQATSLFYRQGRAEMNCASRFTSDGKLMATALTSETIIPLWGDIIVSKTPPKGQKLKVGSGWGCDFYMVPAICDSLACPSWCMHVSHDEADATVKLESIQEEVKIFDGSVVKLNRFVATPVSESVGSASEDKPLVICRSATEDDGKSFQKDGDKLRADTKRRLEDLNLVKRPKTTVPTTAKPSKEAKESAKDAKHLLS